MGLCLFGPPPGTGLQATRCSCDYMRCFCTDRAGCLLLNPCVWCADVVGQTSIVGAHQHVIAPPSTLLANSATSVFMVLFVTAYTLNFGVFHCYCLASWHARRTSHHHGYAMHCADVCTRIAINVWAGQVTSFAGGMAIPPPPLPTLMPHPGTCPVHMPLCVRHHHITR